jgi:DNA polymerase elongation subunit (family B)
MSRLDFPNNEPKFWAWKNKGNGQYEFDLHHATHFVYQDTDSGYFAIPDTYTKTHSLDEIVEASDRVGKGVNDSFKDFIKFSMNIPEERSHLIGTARETVADSAIWLSKKRYILRVVDSEGKRVNKLKMQGVQLKKSNTSPFTKRILRDLVEKILDGADISQLTEFIKDAKKSFYKALVHDIATPMGCAKLNEAEAVYTNTGGFRGVHYAAKAGATWNILSRVTDKKISAGEKIRLVYISGNRLSTSIAFPSDLTTLPDWFNDDIIIDYDTMWQKVDKVITDYLKVIGFDLESRKNELSKELFGMAIAPKKKGKR